MAVAGIFPVHIEIGNEARNEDKVERALTDDLVGDVHAAAFGIPRFDRLHEHPPCKPIY
jgi:hypothetical protein